jgi:3-oxoacyl-[acyl-carrier-protein] synthase III
MSSIVDYADRETCVLFGDGAGAVLIEPAENNEIGLIDFAHEIDGSGAGALNMPGGGSPHPATAETVERKMQVGSLDHKGVQGLLALSHQRSRQGPSQGLQNGGW